MIGVFPLTRLIAFVKKLVVREENATMVEYGLMLALIAVVCVAVIALIGGSLNTKFGAVRTAISP